MQPADYTILIVYLVGLLTISAYLARKAAAGSEAYFLGGRSMPWWALGASGMSSNLDAAGTMTIITLLYTYGLHGFFIEMRGGVVLPIAVFLAFMGKWHQRSQVMTTAEWMHLRFGHHKQGTAARVVAATTYLIITIAMVVFFLAAAGKFLAVFLPFDATTCAVAMALIALVYTMISGLYGVVWTDVFQAFLIGGAALYVAARAFFLVDDNLLAQWPGAAFNQALPQFHNPDLAPYDLFIVFLLFWLGKGVLEGLGGSGGSAYMAQRYYAAPDARTCKHLSLLWAVLFAFRWPMVLGFAIIAIHLGIGQDDPERILPQVLQSEFFPVGLRGMVVAAIFAASMSTFDSTINAGASYVVRDILLPAFPRLRQKGQVIAGYLASAAIVGLGLFLALTFADSVLGVWTTIVIQLFPAFLVPFALRWFWARFNGTGFSFGVAAGFLAALAVNLFPFALNEAATLALIGSTSLLLSLLATYASPPTDPDVTRTFYDQIRPFGLWPREWKQPHAREHRADQIRLPIALLWQILTFLLPMLLVLHQWVPLALLLLPYALLTTFLLSPRFDPSGNQ